MKGKIILFCLSVILVSSSVIAQNGRTRLTKNISKNFSVETNVTIDITNKYGQIIVNTWDYYSVKVAVEIRAFDRNDDAVEKLMDRTDFVFNNFGDYLTIETVLDRKAGFFKEVWNNIGDYSKTLLSKNKISIDYEITIPKKSNLNLDNKFGNVYVNSLTSTSKIKVAHGDFKANELTGNTKLYLSFGKGNVKRFNDGYIELKGAELDIRNSDNIEIESSTSHLQLDKVISLKLNSRNDKVRIEEAKFLKGKAGFSNIIVDSMIDKVNMELNYGEFVVNSVNSNFSNIELNSKSGDVNLNFELESYFDLDLKGKSEEIFLSRNMSNLKKTVDGENDKLIRLEGIIGYPKGKKSKVFLNSDGGEIYLFLQDVGGITKEN